MNNDLISREALKKAIETWDKFACLPNCKLEPFRNLEYPEMFEPYVHLRDIRNAINNAPPVEAVPLEFHEKCMEKTVGELLECQSNLRPKGKWIKTNDYVTCAYGCMDYVKCSCCKNDSLEEGDYCPNCGADMREDET